MAKKERAKFTQIAPKEVRIDYKGFRFLLIEKDRGTLGIGRAVQLYQLNAFEKSHLKEIGWTKSDNHSCNGMEDACINRITNFDACKDAAVKYIDSLL